MMSRVFATEDQTDPRIAHIVLALKCNPYLSRHHLMKAYGLGKPTIDAWVAKGWIPAPKFKARNKEPWRAPIWGLK